MPSASSTTGTESFSRSIRTRRSAAGVRPMILSLAGKAVSAVEIAGVGHMKAQGLHHVPGALFKGSGQGGEGIRRKQFPRILEGLDVGQTLPQLLLRHIRPVRVFLQQSRHDLIAAACFKPGDDVIGHAVHHMDGAGTGVQHNVIAAQLILMYHRKPRFNSKIKLEADP